MHLPPVRQLQYLIALNDTHHFGRAAETLFVTQSTLSTGIKELETNLGVTLVERSNKAVAFTPIGDEIVVRARVILQQYEEMIIHARGFQQPLSMPVRLGVIPTIAPYLIPSFVTDIKRQFPELKLYIRENTTANLVQEMSEGKLDLLILAFPYDTGNLISRIMFREKLLLGSSKHSTVLRPQTGGLDFDALPDESLLLLDDGHCLRNHAMSGCRVGNPKKLNTFGANSLQMLIQMVDNDLGITLIPEMAIASGAMRGTNIVTRDLGDDFFRDVGFVWRKGNYREEQLLLFMDLLKPPNSQSVQLGPLGDRIRKSD